MLKICIKIIFFYEENSLLLKEALTSKGYSVTKCKLCLENFKMKDLNKHMKSLHPTEYEETETDTKHIINSNSNNSEHIAIQGDNRIHSHKLNNNHHFLRCNIGM